MGGEILRLPSGHIDAVDVRVGEGRIDAASVDGLVVATPGHHLPGVTGLLFMGEQPNLAGAPVEDGHVIFGAVLRLIGESDVVTISGPARILLADGRRLREVDDLAAVAGQSVEIPEYVAGVVLPL